MDVAEVVIGNIDENGFLQSTVEELAKVADCDLDMVDEVLSVVRSFDPSGVGCFAALDFNFVEPCSFVDPRLRKRELGILLLKKRRESAA